jgi:RimJ/RimL family protein N-acetyltransferase
MIDNGVVITTPRTYMRKITLDDRRFVERLDWLDSDRVYRRTMKMYEERAYGFWAVILAETGNFAGLCGLLDQRVEGRYELELGYHLLPEYQGRGLATEAARAVMDYAFQSLGKKRLISIILPDNAASIGVAKKNGLVFEREAVFRGLVVSVFAVHNVC